MQSSATDTTADQLLDYLASDGTGGEWTYFAHLSDWESLYNLRRERHFLGRLTRNLADRGLAEIRRAASGFQVRLTTAGEKLAQHREQAASQAVADLDWDTLLA